VRDFKSYPKGANGEICEGQKGIDRNSWLLSLSDFKVTFLVGESCSKLDLWLYSTSGNWCHYLQSSIVSWPLMPRKARLPLA
jgi:hypothetical protein